MENTNTDREIFGSFYLSGCEFAISVKHIQEVVNPPEKYTNLPLAPQYLLGLLNLRGLIIPIVDLKTLLKLPGQSLKGDQKIAILELNGSSIGILFDHTGEIFRTQAEERSDFSETQEGSVIKGVFKKDEGKRLIQILDVFALFGMKALPRESSDGKSSARHAFRNRKGIRKQCISFVVGPAKCALSMNDIQEILKVDKIDNSALGVGFCIGVIDLRRITVPVIDFAFLLGYRDADNSQDATKGDRRVVVLRLGEEFFGILVDGVDSIVSYHDEDLKPFSMLTSTRKEMFTGCISIEGKEDILLLDHSHLLSNGEIQEITHGHSRIYKAAEKLATRKKSTSGLKRTFITFTVDGLFAVPIGEVKEIIDFPAKLLQPPGLPTHCKGLLNLRGDLVTIVDAREMYKIQEKKKSQTPPKVLVFKSKDQHFGLVVDSVEAIVSISEESKIKLPGLLYSGSAGLSEDVVEAIQCKDASGGEQNMLILNSEFIGSRLQNKAA